jgi:hypothetical protein
MKKLLQVLLANSNKTKPMILFGICLGYIISLPSLFVLTNLILPPVDYSKIIITIGDDPRCSAKVNLTGLPNQIKTDMLKWVEVCEETIQKSP